ncbi:MAG: hypothetical protein K6G45_02200 [Lachnospiraceae bacterium]|nr:hypothetical protein [Lachnospiraceae bacterium]
MNLDEFSIFKDNKKTLQHTSRDTSKEPVHYMTYSDRKVVDLDVVKTKVMSQMFGEKDNIARSSDALLYTNNGMYIIEFKNGSFSNTEISQKANNSIMLFNLITGKQIDFTRNNISFVLVYNREAKKLDYRDEKALHIAQMAKIGLPLFGTDKLKSFSYKNVYMLAKDEFDMFINSIDERKD